MKSEQLWTLHSSPDSEDTYSATIEKGSKGFAVISVSEVRAHKISRPKHGRKGGAASRLDSMDISRWFSILQGIYTSVTPSSPSTIGAASHS